MKWELAPQNTDLSRERKPPRDNHPSGDRNGSEPHPTLPQYTQGEVKRSIEAIELLRKVRDRCRAQGLIDW